MAEKRQGVFRQQPAGATGSVQRTPDPARHAAGAADLPGSGAGATNFP